jgi:hypothetical protein
MSQHSLQKGHAPGRQRTVQDDVRQAVDLHDQQPPMAALGRAAPTQAADETINRALQRQGEIVG